MKTAPPWARPATAWALDGRVLRVQCPPVLELVPLLTAPTVYLVMGTLTEPEDRLFLYRQIVRHNSPVDDTVLGAVADALVFTWCGAPRWFARRLWEEVLGHWVAFEGKLTGRGIDVATLPTDRATRLVWATLAEWHANDKDKGQGWRRRIEAEPLESIRRAVKAPAATDDAGATFMSMYAAVGGRPR